VHVSGETDHRAGRICNDAPYRIRLDVTSVTRIVLEVHIAGQPVTRQRHVRYEQRAAVVTVEQPFEGLEVIRAQVLPLRGRAGHIRLPKDEADIADEFRTALEWCLQGRLVRLEAQIGKVVIAGDMMAWQTNALEQGGDFRAQSGVELWLRRIVRNSVSQIDHGGQAGFVHVSDEMPKQTQCRRTLLGAEVAAVMDASDNRQFQRYDMLLAPSLACKSFIFTSCLEHLIKK